MKSSNFVFISIIFLIIISSISHADENCKNSGICIEVEFSVISEDTSITHYYPDYLVYGDKLYLGKIRVTNNDVNYSPEAEYTLRLVPSDISIKQGAYSSSNYFDWTVNIQSLKPNETVENREIIQWSKTLGTRGNWFIEETLQERKYEKIPLSYTSFFNGKRGNQLFEVMSKSEASNLELAKSSRDLAKSSIKLSYITIILAKLAIFVSIVIAFITIFYQHISSKKQDVALNKITKTIEIIAKTVEVNGNEQIVRLDKVASNIEISTNKQISRLDKVASHIEISTDKQIKEMNKLNHENRIRNLNALVRELKFNHDAMETILERIEFYKKNNRKTLYEFMLLTIEKTLSGNYLGDETLSVELYGFYLNFRAINFELQALRSVFLPANKEIIDNVVTLAYGNISPLITPNKIKSLKMFIKKLEKYIKTINK